MALSSQSLPFGEWLPDLPDLENPGATEARNVIAEARSYTPLRSLTSIGSGLTGTCTGFFWLQDSSNNAVLFAGDATSLYRYNSGTASWDNVSKGGGYTAAEWEFTKFGDFVIAVTNGEPPQIYEVGVSALFADLSGSPPQAERIATVQDFVVLGRLSTGPARLQWSAFNNATLWTPSLSTQADFQDIRGRAGRIQAIVPGTSGLIFLQNSIYRMDYTGPPRIFTFSEIEPNRGTPAPNSVCWTSRQVFFYSDDGFYVTDGTGPATPIGSNRVDRWFQTAANASSIGTMRGAVDRRRKLVIWAFNSTGSSTINDRVIIFNWGANRWSYGEADTQVVSDSVQSGLNLDQLDSVLPGGIDLNSIQVDSPIFQGGANTFVAFNSSNQLATFDGTPLAAVLETAEFTSEGAGRVFVNGVRPLVDNTAATMTVQIGSRSTQSDATMFTGAQGLNSIGQADFRVNGRYHRIRVNISGEYEDAQGAIAYLRTAGRR